MIQTSLDLAIRNILYEVKGENYSLELNHLSLFKIK